MKRTLKVFKALSDPTRLRILLLLLQRERCVCELTSILEMEQSRISHQLRVMRNAELVEDIREGKWIIYRISENKKKDSKEIPGDQEKLQASQKNRIRNSPTSSKGETTR
jgi:ArsR family transcriptional regulator